MCLVLSAFFSGLLSNVEVFLLMDPLVLGLLVAIVVVVATHLLRRGKDKTVPVTGLSLQFSPGNCLRN